MLHLRKRTGNRRKFFCFRNEKGQSTIEYLVVTGVLIASLISMPSIYKAISDTMQDKYKSYAFGVAISDPPRKAFDDTVQKDADKVKEVLDTLKDLGQFIENLTLDFFTKGKLPSKQDIDNFYNLLKKLFK